MIFQHLNLLFVLAPLVAAPVVIHLLNKRFPRFFLFSSIEPIKAGAAQRSSLLKWRHWLMALVRTLLVTALLLAFLQPLIARFGQPPATPQQSRSVLIMLDHSLSMERTEGLSSLRARAMAEARKVLAALAPQDKVNVMAAGRHAQLCFSEFSTNTTAAGAFIDHLEASQERAMLNDALQTAGELLRPVQGGGEVYLISDFQRTNWAEANFAALPKTVRVFFVPVTDGKAADNHAVTEADLPAGALLAGSSFNLTVAVANNSAQALNDTLEVVLDSSASFEAPVHVPPWTTQRVAVRVKAPGPGIHPLVARLKTPDGLPQDDAYHLVLAVAEKEEVLLVTDDVAVDEGKLTAAPGALTIRFLEAALNPYADARGSLLPHRISAKALRPEDLATASKVVLTRVGPLAEAQLRALADLLRSGGGVLYFLDGPDDRQNLEALQRLFPEPEAVPLKLMQRQTDESGGAGGALQIGSGAFDSRFLRLFRGQARDQLAQLEFYELWRASPSERGTILLRYADGTPALAQGAAGLGTLLLCNFSVSELSSNLARQRLFPAWVQEMVAHLAGEAAQRESHEPGDAMEVETTLREAQGRDFTGPDGKPAPAARANMGDKVRLTVQAKLPGFYSMRDDRRKPVALLAANPSAIESDLRVMDMDASRRHAEQDTTSAAQVLGPGTNFDELRRGQPVFHWFILAALALLLVETLLQAWFRRLAGRTPKPVT